MKNNIGLVFIHGAGLGSYIWDDVKSKIGMPSLMINFPNRNKGDKVNENLKVMDYVNPIVKEIKQWDQQRVILVTHSIGGMIGLKVAEEIMHQQLSGFIAISSIIPITGGSFISSLPFPQNIMTNFLVKFAGTKPSKAAIIKGYCNDLTPDQTKRVVEKFTPEAKSIYYERISTKIPEVKKMYIKLLNDKELSVELQDKMAKNLKADKVIAFNSGHLPMLSISGQLTSVIHDFVKEIDKDYFNPIGTDFTPKQKKIIKVRNI